MSILAKRAISAFPLSIGTSLALETIFKGRLAPYDPLRIIPAQPPDVKYDEVWINISTILRNMIASLDKNQYVLVTEQEYVSEIYQEMVIIKSLFEIEGRNKNKVTFYQCGYSSVWNKQHPLEVELRLANTPAKLEMSQKVNRILELCKQKLLHDISWFPDTYNQRSMLKGLMLTHIPYDLLSWPYFKSLALLESYTGVLKLRNLWYTKYYSVPNQTLNSLPFDRKLLKIFGDHITFAPMSLALRKQILEIATNRKWTPMTTMDKINYTLRQDFPSATFLEMFQKL
jgi:hypothetical protein